MTVFVLNFFSICLYAIIYDFIKKKYGKSQIVFVFLMVLITAQMCALLALRSVEIGIDTRAYLNRFNRYKLLTLSKIFRDDFQEHGYSLLIKIIAVVYDNFNFFLTCVSLITIPLVVVSVAKLSKKPFLSLLIFIAFDYYASYFCLIRQSIAYSLCILSFLCIQNKKPVKFVLLVLLAAQFHKSAYIFLPAYWIANVKMNKYALITLCMAFAAVFVFKSKLYGLIEHGFYSTVDNIYGERNTGAFTLLVRQFVIAAAMLFFAGKNEFKCISNYNRFTMLVCTGAILTIFATIGSNAQRAANYYCMFLIFGIPELLDSLDDSMVKRVVSITVIAGVLAMFVYSIINDEYSIMPYRLFIK